MTRTLWEHLDELETHPASSWDEELRAWWPDDPALVHQLTTWLHAGRRHDPATAPQLGDLARRYEATRLLDVGATAAVWLAYDRTLARNVALKIFHPERAAGLESVFSEARAACEVLGDHVVRILDVHAGEAPCIVMELVAEHDPEVGDLVCGTSAAALRPRGLREALRWSRDVAQGVADAHLRDVFHRDLKPQNVLITPCSRRAKITDFGLAARASAPTRCDRIVGTPSYVAPEQARGLPALDARIAADRSVLVGIDIWGVGAIAFELLTGRPPWCGTDELDAWEIAATCGRVPALDRTRDGRRIPARVRRIIERCLAPAAADRYASAAELAHELGELLASRPTSFDRSLAVHGGLWLRRNPQLSVAATAAVVLGAMSVGAYANVARLHEERSALATEVEQAARDKRGLSEAAAAARRELAATATEVASQQKALAAVRVDFDAIVIAKENALRTADTATRELAVLRSDLDVATTGRDLYETFWTRARQQADDVTRAHAALSVEAADLRRQHALLVEQRDRAREARARAERARDAAIADRDREAAARRTFEAELTRLASDLAAICASGAEPSPSPRSRRRRVGTDVDHQAILDAVAVDQLLSEILDTGEKLDIVVHLHRAHSTTAPPGRSRPSAFRRSASPRR